MSDAERLGKLNGPVPASELDVKPEDVGKTAEQVAKERVSSHVKGVVAKREALRRSGADVPSSSAGLAGRIENSLKKREKAITNDHRTKAAVRKAQVKLAVRSRLKPEGE